MDPSCPGIVEVRRKHTKRQSLVHATMATNAELRQRFLGEEAADLGAHLAHCDRCDKFQVNNRCPVCGNGLIPEIEGPTCSSSMHRLRVAFGWYDKSKTPSAPPNPPTPTPAPAAAPTPPPRAAPPEPAAPEPEPTAEAPIPAGPQPTAAPTPKAKPKPAPRKRPTPTPAAAPPPPPPPRPPRRRPSRPQGKPAHDVLGVAADADESTVRSAFREKAKSYHPDRVAHLAPEFKEVAEKHMRELNAAYDEAMKHFARKAKKSD